jgi:hypothetical protein
VPFARLLRRICGVFLSVDYIFKKSKILVD